MDKASDRMKGLEVRGSPGPHILHFLDSIGVFLGEIWQFYTLTLHPPLATEEFWIRPCVIVTGLKYRFQDFSDGKLTYTLWQFFPKEMHGKENWWSRWGLRLLRPPYKSGNDRNVLIYIGSPWGQSTKVSFKFIGGSGDGGPKCCQLLAVFFGGGGFWQNHIPPPSPQV